ARAARRPAAAGPPRAPPAACCAPPPPAPSASAPPPPPAGEPAAADRPSRTSASRGSRSAHRALEPVERLVELPPRCSPHHEPAEAVAPAQLLLGAHLHARPLLALG